MVITQNLKGKNRKGVVDTVTLWEVGEKEMDNLISRKRHSTIAWLFGSAVGGYIPLWIHCPSLKKVILGR